MANKKAVESGKFMSVWSTRHFLSFQTTYPPVLFTSASSTGLLAINARNKWTTKGQTGVPILILIPITMTYSHPDPYNHPHHDALYPSLSPIPVTIPTPDAYTSHHAHACAHSYTHYPLPITHYPLPITHYPNPNLTLTLTNENPWRDFFQNRPPP